MRAEQKWSVRFLFYHYFVSTFLEKCSCFVTKLKYMCIYKYKNIQIQIENIEKRK